MTLRRIKGAVLALIAAAALVLGAAGTAQAAPKADELDLTEEEQAYLDSAGTLRVGYVQDRTPVSFTGPDGTLAGISRYIFDRIQRVTGLTFEYVPLPSGPVTYDYLMEQQLDLVTSVEYNKANQGARGILVSEPYFTGRKVIVAREDLDYSYEANLSVAVSSGSQTLRQVLAATYPNFTLEDYDTITACFDALRAGKADLMILNQYVVEYWLTKPLYEDLKVIPVMGLDDQLSFSAVVPFDASGEPVGDDGYTLISILNKAIAAIPEDLTGSYIIQAVIENRYTYNMADVLYRYRYAFTVLAISLMLIAALLLQLYRQHIRSVKAQADARAKSQFLSTMSHEIRTPLNGLIGLNYLMGRRLHEPEQLSRYLDQSTSTARYLLSLVSDILDMSMLSKGDMALDAKPTDMAQLLTTVEAIVHSGMAEKHLDFSLDVRLAEPWLTTDGVRVQQVLLNLLDNAQKFTPEGGSVTLSAWQDPIHDGAVVTHIQVTDTGRGMSQSFRDSIFDAFSREQDTVSSGDQGVGLGLSICHRLAKLMDGDLTFTSEQDKGSQFTFSFPAAPCAAPEGMPAAEMHGPATPRVLVAEDNELNGEIMLELLEDAGYEAVLASDGQKALDAFLASAPGEYGVILMDLLMPNMDGFAAAAAIRALDRPDAGSVRIIACSANCTAEDRSHAAASGMDGFLAKPVDVNALLDELKK